MAPQAYQNLAAAHREAHTCLNQKFVMFDPGGWELAATGQAQHCFNECGRIKRELGSSCGAIQDSLQTAMLGIELLTDEIIKQLSENTNDAKEAREHVRKILEKIGIQKGTKNTIFKNLEEVARHLAGDVRACQKAEQTLLDFEKKTSVPELQKKFKSRLDEARKDLQDIKQLFEMKPAAFAPQSSYDSLLIGSQKILIQLVKDFSVKFNHAKATIEQLGREMKSWRDEQTSKAAQKKQEEERRRKEKMRQRIEKERLRLEAERELKDKKTRFYRRVAFFAAGAILFGFSLYFFPGKLASRFVAYGIFPTLFVGLKWGLDEMHTTSAGKFLEWGKSMSFFCLIPVLLNPIIYLLDWFVSLIFDFKLIDSVGLLMYLIPRYSAEFFMYWVYMGIGILIGVAVTPWITTAQRLRRWP